MSAFPRQFRCYECNAVLDVIDGEKVEPCWDCISRAKEAERRKVIGPTNQDREQEAKLEEKLEEIRSEYPEIRIRRIPTF